MAKEHTADDRVAVLERELQLTREQHAAELAAIRDDIKAAREHSSSAAREIADAIRSAIEPGVGRMEAIDPATARQREEKKLAEMVDNAAALQIEPYKTLLDGPKAFFVCAMEPPKGGDGSIKTAYARPAPGLCRLVCAGSEESAIAKYESNLGIVDPQIRGLSKYSEGVFPRAIEATDAEAAPVKKKCLEYIEQRADPGKLIALMLKAGEKAFADRAPVPEDESLEKMLAD